MKTTIKKSVVVLVLLFTLVNFANEEKNFKINSVKVEFASVKKGQTLTIKDDQQVIIYSQKIENTGSFSKTFDFTALKNGVYSTELEKDFEFEIKTFKVENDAVIFLNKEVEKIHKPYVRSKNNLILISKINFNNQPLKLKIYYKGDLILDETIKEKNLLNKVYRLLESEKGNYKVVLKSDDRMYVKDFIL